MDGGNGFCTKCGAKLNRDIRFCPGCGEKIISLDKDQGSVARSEPVAYKSNNVKKNRTIIIIISALAVSIAIGVIFWVACGQSLPAKLTANKWVSEGGNIILEFYDSGSYKWSSYLEKPDYGTWKIDGNKLIMQENGKSHVNEYEFAANEEEADRDLDTWYITDKTFYLYGNKYHAIE